MRDAAFPVETSLIEPVGALAALLGGLVERTDRKPVIFAARDSRRVAELEPLLRAFFPNMRLALLPAWDCLPFDGTPPSAAIMGIRAGTLRWLTDPETPPDLVLTTSPALLQRVPPRSVWEPAHLSFQVGEPFDPESAEARLQRVGYIRDDRVDEPGEYAVRGQVLDLFPAAAPRPCRVEFEDGRVTAIRSYDPATQRSVVETEILDVDPATEIVAAGDAPPGRADAQWLPDYYPGLETVFDYVPHGALILEPGAEERAASFLEQVEEGYRLRLEVRSADETRRPVKPERLYLRLEEWQGTVDAQAMSIPRSSIAEAQPTTAFVGGDNGALQRFLEKQLQGDLRVVLAAPTKRVLRRLQRRVEAAAGRDAAPADDWASVTAAAPGDLLTLEAPVERSFDLPDERIAVLAAADVLGRIAAVDPTTSSDALPFGEDGLKVGDAVIHLDHGVGILERLEETAAADGQREGELIRLRYADDAALMLPVREAAVLWRQGGDPDVLTLDRLESDVWSKRRAALQADIDGTAARLIEMARERDRRRAPVLEPPERTYEQFVRRFPYPLTPDQRAAVDAVRADLASGRPMDRLVCGDVGFGKTEVAMRAVAAAIFSGKQVVVMAPTTVLVRQHLQTFRRRFASFGIEVEELSRLMTPTRARQVKAGLADGTLRLVIGTQALAAKTVRFQDLGLVVIDEEHRFGTAQKAKLRDLASRAHVLTLTATPIPRTLQANLVGLQDLSIIATPPAMRQPVRTLFTAWDDATVRQALLREKERGGQSFVVCPRIEDIEPVAARLQALVPELLLRTAHGKMPAGELDDVMVDFAEGAGDVLLATNIIESGLDVPRANTILIWSADRFGLAQLHQLRGRVGRGSRRGVAFLFLDPERGLSAAAEKRMRALETANGLGAGFALSARDLELRGSGDLFGPEQAGQIKLIGMDLYRHLLKRALAAAKGAPVDDWTPDLRVGVSGWVPKEYVPEDEVRLDLYRRIYGAADEAALEALEEEVLDRFGPLPEELTNLFGVATLILKCRQLGIARLDVGPKAVAASFRDEATGPTSQQAERMEMRWHNGRLIGSKGGETNQQQLLSATRFLARLTDTMGR